MEIVTQYPVECSRDPIAMARLMADFAYDLWRVGQVVVLDESQVLLVFETEWRTVQWLAGSIARHAKTGQEFADRVSAMLPDGWSGTFRPETSEVWVGLAGVGDTKPFNWPLSHGDRQMLVYDVLKLSEKSAAQIHARESEMLARR